MTQHAHTFSSDPASWLFHLHVGPCASPLLAAQDGEQGLFCLREGFTAVVPTPGRASVPGEGRVPTTPVCRVSVLVSRLYCLKEDGDSSQRACEIQDVPWFDHLHSWVPFNLWFSKMSQHLFRGLKTPGVAAPLLFLGWWGTVSIKLVSHCQPLQILMSLRLCWVEYYAPIKRGKSWHRLWQGWTLRMFC